MNAKLEAKLRLTVDKELNSCSNGLYPNLCQLRQTAMGKNKVYKLVLDILSKNVMSIRSALAQIESSI